MSFHVLRFHLGLMCEIDILFGIVKGIQRQRPELRVVAMSASLDASLFASYFGCRCLLAHALRLLQRAYCSDLWPAASRT